MSADPIILAVAAHDTGEYVRHYPRGKQWVTDKLLYNVDAISILSGY